MSQKPQIQILLEDVAFYLRQSRSPQAAKLLAPLSGVISAMGKKRLDDAEIFANWQPTPANIQTLPLPIRQHIESCERLIKENEALREQLSVRINALIATRLVEPFDVVSHFSKLAELMEVLA